MNTTPEREKVAAFSHLCGRTDLIELVRELKQEGFTTILGGPQARQDYRASRTRTHTRTGSRD